MANASLNTVRLMDSDGDALDDGSGKLNVNATLVAGATIDIGDVDMFLDGGTAVLGGAGAVAAGVLRVTLASDDVHFGAVGAASDADGTIHGQLYFANLKLSTIASNSGYINSSLNNIESYTGYQLVSTGAQYSEGDIHTVGIVRNDTLASLVTDDNDYAPLQVNASGALYVDIADGGQLDTIIDTLETTLTAIETDQAAIEVLLTAANVDHAANEALLITIDSDTNAIKTAVEILDNAISGSEMQVDVVASLPAGSNTIGVVDLGSTDNAVLDAMVVDLAAMEVLLTAIDSDTDAIKTAVQILDNAISGSEMQVDVVASLPAGTNAIGKLAANSGVDIGDVDVTSTVHPAGNGTFNSYAQFTAATTPTALTDATNGVNGIETAAKEVIIQADFDNSAYIMVGDSGAAADTNGIRLNAGDTIILPVANIANIYIDASAGSQTVNVTVIK